MIYYTVLLGNKNNVCSLTCGGVLINVEKGDITKKKVQV